MMMFKKNHFTNNNAVAEQLAPEQVVITTNTPVEMVQEVSNESLSGYQRLLASINEFLSEMSIIGQFHMFVQLCIAVAAISSL